MLAVQINRDPILDVYNTGVLNSLFFSFFVQFYLSWQRIGFLQYSSPTSHNILSISSLLILSGPIRLGFLYYVCLLYPADAIGLCIALKDIDLSSIADQSTKSIYNP